MLIFVYFCILVCSYYSSVCNCSYFTSVVTRLPTRLLGANYAHHATVSGFRVLLTSVEGDTHIDAAQVRSGASSAFINIILYFC